MNKDNFEYIKSYEYIFTQAREGYAQAISTYVMEQFKRIYEEESKTKFGLNMNCSKCKLELLQKLGNIYFNDKEKIENTDGKTTGIRHREDRDKEKGETKRSVLKASTGKSKKA